MQLVVGEGNISSSSSCTPFLPPRYASELRDHGLTECRHALRERELCSVVRQRSSVTGVALEDALVALWWPSLWWVSLWVALRGRVSGLRSGSSGGVVLLLRSQSLRFYSQLLRLALSVERSESECA